MADHGALLPPRERLRLGPLTIEPATRRLLHDDGREEFLEPRVIQLFVALVKADGAILSRDDLVDLCWDSRAISDDAVFRALSRLRRATEGIGAGIFRLETIPKAGYRLVRLDAEQPAPGQAPAAEAAAPGPATAPPLARRGLLLAVGALGAGGLAFALTRSRPAPPAASPERLAILPFAPLGDTTEEISDAVSGELMRATAAVPGLDVIAPVSAFLVPRAERTPKGAANLLGATLVLTGGVQATPDALRITARLARAPEGEAIWSRTLAGPPGDFYRLQRAIVADVARTAGLEVGGTAPRAVDPEAFRLYLEGWSSWAAEGAPGRAQAEGRFTRAVRRDPGFAEAWAALGSVTLQTAYLSWVHAPLDAEFNRDQLMAAVFAAERATALKPELPLPYLTVANALGYLGSWADSSRAAEAAVARGAYPFSPLGQLGQLRRNAELARREAALSPLDADAQAGLGAALRHAGDYRAAVVAGERAFVRAQTAYTLYEYLLQLIAVGRHAQARALMDAHPALLQPSLDLYAPTSRAFLLWEMGMGPRPDPQEIVAQVNRGEAYQEMAAVVLARLGALPEAAAMLDRMGAYEVPVIYMVFQARCAILRPLDSFSRLMQRVGLAAFWRETGRLPDFSADLAPSVLGFAIS